jgi:hypothetical protein
VPAEITITPTAQKTRINCMQTLGILVTRLIILNCNHSILIQQWWNFLSPV